MKQYPCGTGTAIPRYWLVGIVMWKTCHDKCGLRDDDEDEEYQWFSGAGGPLHLFFMNESIVRVRNDVLMVRFVERFAFIGESTRGRRKKNENDG